LRTVETAAVLEALETRVRPGRRSIRKTILDSATWPPVSGGP
jgi:hypothetical protein